MVAIHGKFKLLNFDLLVPSTTEGRVTFCFIKKKKKKSKVTNVVQNMQSYQITHL